MFELFKTLLGSGKAASLLMQARSELLTTLAQAHELLQAALPHLLEPGDPEGLAERAKQVDKASNKAERQIRKLLIEHLAFHQADAPACLVLMSVAKDAERLVDECRNVVELSAQVREPTPVAYRDELQNYGAHILTTLTETRRAFADNDEALALALVEGEKPFVSAIAVVMDRIMDDEALGVRRAVLAWRAFRGLRRVRAHIANIASTVVFPVHRIDFAKRSYIEDARRDLGLNRPI